MKFYDYEQAEEHHGKTKEKWAMSHYRFFIGSFCHHSLELLATRFFKSIAFLKNELGLAIDGQNSDYIRDVLSEEVDAMENRHAVGASIFSQAGTYAPTLGVLGAVVGLIAALSDLNDIDALGVAISAAFIATLLGIFTGYVLWHPFANKLKRKLAEEVRQRMMIEGVLSVLEGEAPRANEHCRFFIKLGTKCNEGSKLFENYR